MTISSIHRNTKQRELILEELSKVCSHPTAKQIHILAKKKMPSIGLATVYRSLDFLLKNNQIIKLKSKNSETRYDANLTNHYHLVCRECGEVDDIFDIKNIKINSKELDQIGFKTELNYLEIPGVCKNCQII